MTYVTNAERFGFERGIEQGMTQEARSLIRRQLTRRVGMIAPNTESQIATLSIS